MGRIKDFFNKLGKQQVPQLGSGENREPEINEDTKPNSEVENENLNLENKNAILESSVIEKAYASEVENKAQEAKDETVMNIGNFRKMMKSPLIIEYDVANFIKNGFDRWYFNNDTRASYYSGKRGLDDAKDEKIYGGALQRSQNLNGFSYIECTISKDEEEKPKKVILGRIKPDSKADIFEIMQTIDHIIALQVRQYVYLKENPDSIQAQNKRQIEELYTKLTKYKDFEIAKDGKRVLSHSDISKKLNVLNTPSSIELNSKELDKLFDERIGIFDAPDSNDLSNKLEKFINENPDKMSVEELDEGMDMISDFFQKAVAIGCIDMQEWEEYDVLLKNYKSKKTISVSSTREIKMEDKYKITAKLEDFDDIEQKYLTLKQYHEVNRAMSASLAYKEKKEDAIKVISRGVLLNCMDKSKEHIQEYIRIHKGNPYYKEKMQFLTDLEAVCMMINKKQEKNLNNGENEKVLAD